MEKAFVGSGESRVVVTSGSTPTHTVSLHLVTKAPSAPPTPLTESDLLSPIQHTRLMSPAGRRLTPSAATGALAEESRGEGLGGLAGGQAQAVSREAGCRLLRHKILP